MNKVLTILFLVFSFTSSLSAYQYQIEIKLTNGEVHRYSGYTNDGKMEDFFGHDPADVVKKDTWICPYPND